MKIKRRTEMEKRKMESVSYEVVLKNAVSLPGVKINRQEFLSKELKKYYPPETIQKAIETSPSNAGIPRQTINTIAKGCIAYETNKVSAISFAAGLPGGVALFGTVPADLVQYFGHILRILQKLVYLYDWEDLFNDETGIDDETTNLLTLFVGVMFGVNSAATVLNKIAQQASEKAYKSLMAKALTKGTIYPIVKKIAASIGVKMTKDMFAKGVSKVVPVIGGVASGGLTYVTYRPMAGRLQKYLSGLDMVKSED